MWVTAVMVRPRPWAKQRRSIAVPIALILIAWSASADQDDWVFVKWVVDGDTIVLKDGRHVRYIGIDTPEIDHQNHRAQPMGYRARSLNRQLVEGRRLKLVSDREINDRYGRLLAYVYRSDGLLVNTELVKQGCAIVLYRFPNISQIDRLLDAQRDAMAKGKGLWRLIDKNEQPSDGYVGNRRSRRFHTPDCPMGKRVSMKNRVRLKTQWAAFWAGYAPDRGCIDFPMQERH
jgi:micrococcal nuclease